MAKRAVWGIDIGKSALKAVRGHIVDERIEVLAFDMIEYGAGAAESETDRDSAIRQALATFLGRNEIGKDSAYASTSAHNALVRFIKLPPVDKKNLPNLIRYEAHQQIPFPLDEVIWDYEAMDRGFMPGEEIEVGIFAMRKEVIHRYLSNLNMVNLEIEVLQVAPLALYNFVSYETPPETGATVVVDVGADDTDLVVVSAERLWTRNLPIAGNDLTVAVARQFEIPFEKAEVLKRKASKSKYRNEIYAAMKPALKGLVDELQRSVGFYKGLHPNTRLDGVLALGNAFKLPGLGKYLMSALQYPVTKLGGLSNFQANNALRLNVYRENPMSFAVALGLVAQGCKKGVVNTNLLPREIINRRILRSKKYAGLVAAAVVAGFVTVSLLNATSADGRVEQAKVGTEKINAIRQKLDTEDGNYRKAKSQSPGIIAQIEKIANQAGGRSEWPFILERITRVIENEPPIQDQEPPDPEKWKDGQQVDQPELLFPSRNDIWIESMDAEPAAIQDAWKITLTGECRRRSEDALTYLKTRLLQPLEEIPCFLAPNYPDNWGWPNSEYKPVDVNGVVVGQATTDTRGTATPSRGRGRGRRGPGAQPDRRPGPDAAMPSDVGVRPDDRRRTREGERQATPVARKPEERVFLAPFTPFVVEFVYDPRKKAETLKVEKERDEETARKAAEEAETAKAAAEGASDEAETPSEESASSADDASSGDDGTGAAPESGQGTANP